MRSLSTIRRNLIAVLAVLLAASGCSWLARADVKSNGKGVAGERVGPWSTPVSADGRYVAFVTSASLARADTDGTDDVYRRDLLTGHTTLVTTSDALNSVTAGLDASSDGNLIVFATEEPLTDDDQNSISDAYVANVATGGLQRVSVATSGELGDQVVSVSNVAISGDGTTVAMQLEYDDNSQHLIVRTLATGVTTEIPDAVDRDLYGITDDGATVLSLGNVEPALYHWTTHTTVTLAGCNAGTGAISGDGRYLVADFFGGGVCPVGTARYDTTNGQFTPASIGHGSPSTRSIGANGRLFVWTASDPNVPGIEPFQVYVHDFFTGANQRLSSDAFGGATHGGAGSAFIGDAGTVTAFTGTGEYTGDTVGVPHVMVRTTLRPLVAPPSPAQLARGSSHVPVVMTAQGVLQPLVDMGPGVTVHSAVVLADGTLALDVSVAPTAPPGTRDVVVTNQGVVGFGVGGCVACFRVT